MRFINPWKYARRLERQVRDLQFENEQLRIHEQEREQKWDCICPEPHDGPCAVRMALDAALAGATT